MNGVKSHFKDNNTEKSLEENPNLSSLEPGTSFEADSNEKERGPLVINKVRLQHSQSKRSQSRKKPSKRRTRAVFNQTQQSKESSKKREVQSKGTELSANYSAGQSARPYQFTLDSARTSGSFRRMKHKLESSQPSPVERKGFKRSKSKKSDLRPLKKSRSRSRRSSRTSKRNIRRKSRDLERVYRERKLGKVSPEPAPLEPDFESFQPKLIQTQAEQDMNITAEFNQISQTVEKEPRIPKRKGRGQRLKRKRESDLDINFAQFEFRRDDKFFVGQLDGKQGAHGLRKVQGGYTSSKKKRKEKENIFPSKSEMLKKSEPERSDGSPYANLMQKAFSKISRGGFWGTQSPTKKLFKKSENMDSTPEINRRKPRNMPPLSSSKSPVRAFRLKESVKNSSRVSTVKKARISQKSIADCKNQINELLSTRNACSETTLTKKKPDEVGISKKVVKVLPNSATIAQKLQGYPELLLADKITLQREIIKRLVYKLNSEKIRRFDCEQELEDFFYNNAERLTDLVRI